jgi:hypothetical protein
MDLDTTHNAFHGSYERFNMFRQAVYSAAGGSYPPHQDKSLSPDLWYIENGELDRPGLWYFLNHSVCDGEISPEMCVQVADDLEELTYKIRELFEIDLWQFIAGCRKAALLGQPLELR